MGGSFSLAPFTVPGSLSQRLIELTGGNKTGYPPGSLKGLEMTGDRIRVVIGDRWLKVMQKKWQEPAAFETCGEKLSTSSSPAYR